MMWFATGASSHIKTDAAGESIAAGLRHCAAPALCAAPRGSLCRVGQGPYFILVSASGAPLAQAADAAAGFANAAVRRGFMRKVLFIVLLQLIVTAGGSLVFYYVQPLKVP